MKIRLEYAGLWWESDLSRGTAISIEMDFAGAQPNHFGTDRAQSHALEMGDFVGDTRRGGGCNVNVLQIIPHCNGTHTETVGHILNDPVFVGREATQSLLMAALLTVDTEPADGCRESYVPDFESGDQVITARQLEQSWEKAGKPTNVDAIVLRTLPNEVDKRSFAYGSDLVPAFLTIEAITWIRDTGVRHLLIDLPSIDRIYDEGRLTNHHLFWNVAAGSHHASKATRRTATITELIYVPNSLKDGRYLLNLQVPAFLSDAAPSRPILYPLERVE